MISPTISQKSNLINNLLSSPSMIQKLQQQLFTQEKTLSELFQKNNHHNNQHVKNCKIQSLNQELPQILDIHRTKEIRQRHIVLRKVIDQTIQILLKFYRQNNNSNNKNKKGYQEQNEPINQEVKQEEIFQRLTFIFTQMNEINTDIQNTITYLNGGNNSSNAKVQKQNKITTIPTLSSLNQAMEANISQRSAHDEQGPLSPYNGHLSISQRFPSGSAIQNSKMQEQNKQSQQLRQ